MQAAETWGCPLRAICLRRTGKSVLTTAARRRPDVEYAFRPPRPWGDVWRHKTHPLQNGEVRRSYRYLAGVQRGVRAPAAAAPPPNHRLEPQTGSGGRPWFLSGQD